MNRMLVLAGAAVAAVVAVMIRQNSRAQAEAELWSEATEPRERRGR